MKLKTWIALGSYLVAGTVCFASGVSTVGPNSTLDGFFIGVGASYNSLNLTQDSWGKGVSNIRTNTGANSNGVAEGTGAPFNVVNNILSPSLQAGYFKHLCDSPTILGVKFLYQYLNSTTTNYNLFIPQLGQTTSAVTGITSPLYGWVNANSVQSSATHEVTFLFLGGRSFGNASFYLGLGPSLINLKSQNYYSIGYADYEGATINVTGLVSYSSPSIWALGGTVQLGASYTFNPCWFLDLSYTYTFTGNNTTNHQQPFYNASSIGSTTYTTSGTIYTKQTLSLKNQTIMLTINRVFNF